MDFPLSLFEIGYGYGTHGIYYFEFITSWVVRHGPSNAWGLRPGTNRSL